MQAEIWKEYCRADVIIVGHDNCFLKSTLSGLPTVLLARLLGKPVVVYSASIGPLENRLQSFLGRWMLNLVSLITLREDISYEYLQKLGVNQPRMYLTADPAFLLQPASPQKAETLLSREGIDTMMRPIIGMTVCRATSSHAFPHTRGLKGKYEQYLELLRQVIDYLTGELNAQVVFLPHVIMPGKNDDRVVASDIYSRVRNQGKVRVIRNEYSPEELKGMIGRFDLFIGERMHSVIAATTMGIPSLAIADPSPRVHGIIGGCLGQERWIIDADKLDFEQYILKINQIWENREKVKKDLISRAEAIKEQALLNGRLLKELMDSLRVGC